MLEGKVEETVQKNKLFEAGERIVVGVSGGPDSMSLLHLLLEWRSSMGLELMVAHLNHGFREASVREATFVREICSKWGVPYYGGRIDVPFYQKRWGVSAQEAARWARFYFYRKAVHRFNATKVAVGHHRDDQVETVLLNFLHGAGLDGLTGMKAARQTRGIKIIRPLFGVTRGEIEDYCREKRIPYVQDESNFKSVYRRNRVRRELLPYLEEYNPRIKEALFKLSSLLEADRNYLNKVTASYLKKLSRIERGKVNIIRGGLCRLPVALQRRLVRKAYYMAVKAGPGLDTFHVERLIELAGSGQTGKEVSLPGKGLAYVTSSELVLQLVSPGDDKQGLSPVMLHVPGETRVPGLDLVVRTRLEVPANLSWPPGKNQAYVDYHRLSFPLYLRTRKPGDRFKPLGMDRSKKIKDFFIDTKIPRQERDRYPLVVAGNEVVWVVGQRLSNDYKVTKETSKVLVIEVEEIIKRQ